MSRPQFSFKGIWIPDFIMEMLVEGEINPTEMALLAMIFAMSKGSQGCYASREYLAEKMGMSVDHTKRLISKFRKMGLIVDLGFDGRRQKIKTCWDEGYRKCHGRRGIYATAKKTSSSSSSERGGIDATADQANNNKKERENRSHTLKLGQAEVSELMEAYGVTAKALKKVGEKYRNFCDDKGKPLTLAGFKLFLTRERWDYDDYTPDKQMELTMKGFEE